VWRSAPAAVGQPEHFITGAGGYSYLVGETVTPEHPYVRRGFSYVCLNRKQTTTTPMSFSAPAVAFDLSTSVGDHGLEPWTFSV
jgi:hypothetical protein